MSESQAEKNPENGVSSVPVLETGKSNPFELNEKEVQSGEDVALGYYRESTRVNFTTAEQTRVLRKIDLYLLPLMMVTGFLQYLDKQAIQYSVLYKLEPDLHMSTKQFSWANSLFYFGFLVWQYPSLLLLQRFSISKYFSAQVLAWGIFSLLMASPTNFGGLGALRFLLGAAETIQLPAFSIITNMYYKRSEQPFRIMFWYGMNGVATIAGGLFAYGVGHIHSGVHLWRYPFIICGSLSTAWSIVLFLMLPDNPSTAWFLTHEERVIAVARVTENQTGIESKVFKPEQVFEALTDPKTWLTGLGAGAGNILGGVSAFAGLLIRSFGFTTLQTTLLQLPTGLIEIISLIIFTIAATYIKNSRMSFAAVAGAISLTGSVMLYAIDLKNKWALMAGFWLMTGVIPCAFILSLGTLSANIGGHTKKITAQAIFFIIYCVGNIVGPQLYKEAPYREGLRANVVVLSLVLGTNFCTLFYMVYENRQRRKYLKAHETLVEEDFAFRDLTDKQNPFCLNVL